VNADRVLHCRIPEPLRERIDALARERGETTSTWVRAVLGRALDDVALNPRVVAVEANDRGARLDRITIRLRPGDGARLRHRSNLRSMKPSTYVAALVRRHVGAAPPLPQPELRALKHTLSELAATMRLVRAACGEGQLDASAAAALARDVDAVRAAVADLVRRNAESWSGDA
jgi:predicted DNA-binding protein